MLTKINRQKCLDTYPKFPTADDNKELYYFPKSTGSYTLTLPAKSPTELIKLMAHELTDLFLKMNLESLIFLGDSKTSWLYQHNNYKPVKEALQFLIDNKVGQKFNGAVEIKTSQLKTFLKHIAWLTRCNASLPNFHFSDKEQNFIGNICKYGNWHLNTLNKLTDKKIKELINDSKLDYSSGQCTNSFSKSSSIKYRQIVV